MELLELIKDALDKVKAKDVKIYDLRGISPIADFTIIATVDVARQATSCIDYLNLEERNQKLKIRNVEGRETTWILLDLYDVILHIFTPDERKNFDLDRLYLNVPQINL